MDINQDQLRELIIELINFIDKKVSINEMTTKGCGDLKYKIYSNNKEDYNYN
ncbi:hypothetical protein [Cetobacterium sp.]|uniref:hypothetical protein n=1 Tax=Cetobacterium sp. TaxID=2071632 RepID=UPI003EE7B92B